MCPVLSGSSCLCCQHGACFSGPCAFQPCLPVGGKHPEEGDGSCWDSTLFPGFPEPTHEVLRSGALWGMRIKNSFLSSPGPEILGLRVKPGSTPFLWWRLGGWERSSSALRMLQASKCHSSPTSPISADLPQGQQREGDWAARWEGGKCWFLESNSQVTEVNPHSPSASKLFLFKFKIGHRIVAYPPTPPAPQ